MTSQTQIHRTDTHSTTSSRLTARLGTALRQHQRLIVICQWAMVCLYLMLLVLPAIHPPTGSVHFYENFRMFAQLLLWGIWWPSVILCTMLFGRVWCGVFCPEGALTEWASRHGRNHSIPRWIRWHGWPFITFAFITLYGQLTGVFRQPMAALLILGSSTAAAIAVGYAYGKQKRIWCRYLCPANALFSPLAKIAVLHFKVAPEPWKMHKGRLPAVNCAPLIDIRHMKSTSTCHACGRCSDYLGAVQLSTRTPSSEILSTKNKDTNTTEALTLIFGMIGISMAACHWPISPWLTALKSLASHWIANHPSLQALQHPTPSWLLMTSIHTDIAATWLEGICLLIFIAGGGMLLGLATIMAIWSAARLTAISELSWQRLALALVPLAGFSLLLGLSLQTLNQLNNSGFTCEQMPVIKTILLTAGSVFSGWLGWKMISPASLVRRGVAFMVFAIPLLLIDLIWIVEHSA